MISAVSVAALVALANLVAVSITVPTDRLNAQIARQRPVRPGFVALRAGAEIAHFLRHFPAPNSGYPCEAICQLI
jgi:hypothetical protein